MSLSTPFADKALVSAATSRPFGKAVLATMGGGTLTATKDGDKIVVADASGHKATVTQADDQFSNGVVHHVDAVLMPSKDQSAKPAVGQKAG